MVGILTDLLLKRPHTVLGVLLAWTAVAGVLATRMEFEFSPQALMGGDAALLDELDDFKSTFAYEDSALLIVVEATGDEDVIQPDVLTWQAELTEALGEISTIERVESLTNLLTVRRGLRIPPQLEAVPVIFELPVDESAAVRFARHLDRAPLATGTLVSADRRVATVMAFIDPEIQDVARLKKVIQNVQGILDQHPAPDGYHVALSGLPYLRVDTVDNLQADQVRLLPLALLCYLVTLAVLFRRVSGSLLPIVATGMGLAWMLGSLVLLGQSFNLISNVLPVLIITIGASNCVHFIDDYAEQFVRSGGDRYEAARRTNRHMARACAMTLATTAVGFGSLMMARSDVLRDFGWQAALGMGCLYLAIMGVVGASVRFFRPPRRSISGAPLGQAAMRLSDTLDRHPWMAVSAAILLVIGSLVVSRNMRINSQMIETYDPGHPTLQTIRLVDAELSGLLPIEVDLTTEDPQRLIDPAIVRGILDFTAEARREPDVLFVRSFVDLRAAFTGDLPEDGIPYADLTAAQLAQHLERSSWVLDRVGAALSYDRFATTDGTRARILIKVRDAGTARLAEIINTLKSDLGTHLPPGCGVSYQLTGDAYVNTVAMNGVIHDLFTSLLTASVAIFVLMAVVFRSLRLGLITAIPNLTPLILTLGYMGLRGYDLNAGNVIVFTISLGMAVDDTIHFIFRYRVERRRQADVAAAIHNTIQGTGRAIVITSVLIVSGLLVLLLSDFVPTRRFAELTSVTMIGALIGDLVLLPACLLLFDGNEQRQKSQNP